MKMPCRVACRRLVAHLQRLRAVCREAEAMSGGERVHSDISVAGPKRLVDERAIALEVFLERSVREEVGPEVAKGALVGHQSQRHPITDADADLVRVDTTQRNAAACTAELVPDLQVGRGRVVHEPTGGDDESQRVRDPVDLLGAVRDQAPELESHITGCVHRRPRHRRSAKTAGPPPERMREKTETPRPPRPLDYL